jgi:hypothetical protein
MGKVFKILVIVAVCLISALGIYGIVRTARLDENTED